MSATFIFGILLAPLATALLTMFACKNESSAGQFSIVASCLYGLSVILMLFFHFDVSHTFELFKITDSLSLSLGFDQLSAIFLIVVALLWPAATTYAVGYLQSSGTKHQQRFLCFYHLAIFAAVGVLLADNLLTLYLFYELLSLLTYPLVAHGQDSSARSGARRYLIYIVGPSIGMLLPAMLFIYWQTGSLAFDGSAFTGAVSQPGLILVMMTVYGLSKAALMPLHSWLPGAMVAPTPVSALLHAVAVVKVGVFSLLRIFNDFYTLPVLAEIPHLKETLLLIASVSILWPSIVALSADNLKRRLAFSTISQLAYISFGAFLLSEAAITTSAAHIMMHAFAKITLFFAAGAIYVAHQKKYVSELNGLAYQMPWTFSAIFIGAAGVVGLPLTGGFVTKLGFLTAAYQYHPALLAVFILSALLSSFYLFGIVFAALKPLPLFSDGTTRSTSYQEAPLLCLIPLIFTAALTILSFFCAEPILNLANQWSKY